jgi:hypothetical protein
MNGKKGMKGMNNYSNFTIIEIVEAAVAAVAIMAIAIAIYYNFSYIIVENYADVATNVSDANANNHIYFMTYKETANFFAKDNDNYVRNLSELDLHARGVKTHVEYMNQIEDTAISFTDDEKELLERCAKDADKYLRNERFKELDYGKHLNGNDIADIKWIFANTYTNYFNDVIKENEQGLPHTRENIILLSKNVLKNDALNLTNTLLHEKIHIYQRYNPEIFDTIIKEMGLHELERKHFKQAKYIRSNPDTNNKIYYRKKSSGGSGGSVFDILSSGFGGGDDDTVDTDYDLDDVMVCLYRNDKPNSINDVIQKNYSAEHPYEKIAYEIAENFYKNNKNKYINI